MNLLLLVFLTIFTLGTATVPPINKLEKVKGDSDVSEKIIADNQAEPNSQDATEDKKVAKRSYGWNPWSYIGYSYWPWYGFGWYPSWPLYYSHGYSGYGGYGGYSGYGGYGGHGYGGYSGYGYGYRSHGGWYKG
ncbi:cold and drought-regulated protein CORA-like [Bombus pyrosoma]|uniref:cold and drought-regulated protein CORA-like n=1 Tax=Bombus pyrosoma TaxID=396416 RepID=UPI001CB8B576|nr:cold and drought-regulated protein CORA-like [Bombus pyrosoma]